MPNLAMQIKLNVHLARFIQVTMMVDTKATVDLFIQIKFLNAMLGLNEAYTSSISTAKTLRLLVPYA